MAVVVDVAESMIHGFLGMAEPVPGRSLSRTLRECESYEDWDHSRKTLSLERGGVCSLLEASEKNSHPLHLDAGLLGIPYFVAETASVSFATGSQ